MRRLAPRIVGIALAGTLALPASPAVAARPVGGGDYSGEAGLAESVEFTVSRGRGRLSVSLIVLVSDCSNGRAYVTVIQSGDIRVTRTGRFSGRLGEDLGEEPFTRVSRVTMRGRFTNRGRRASGTVSAHIEGEGGTTCGFGPRSFMVRLEQMPSRPMPRFTG